MIATLGDLFPHIGAIVDALRCQDCRESKDIGPDQALGIKCCPDAPVEGFCGILRQHDPIRDMEVLPMRVRNLIEFDLAVVFAVISNVRAGKFLHNRQSLELQLARFRRFTFRRHRFPLR